MGNHCIDCDYCGEDLRLHWNFHKGPCDKAEEALKCSLMNVEQKNKLLEKMNKEPDVLGYQEV